MFRGSPYACGQTAPCWVEISHNGKYLFTVNTGPENISSYSINPDARSGRHHRPMLLAAGVTHHVPQRACSPSGQRPG